MCIGPSGEKCVRFATIQHELGHGAGRTGMGAVMGAKNLKAIAVRGTKGLKLSDSKLFLTVAEDLKQAIKLNPTCQEMATHGVSRIQDKMFTLLWDPSMPKPPRQHAIFEKFAPKRDGCHGCPVQCMDQYSAGDVGSGTISCELYNFTAEVDCYDSALSLECAILAQRFGIDCVSVVVIIHWLMEMFAKGIISEKDTDGIPMQWGTREAIRGMLEKIANRDGIGDILAEGILPAAKKFGPAAEELANQVKGIPMAEAWGPESLPLYKGTALSNVVGPRGDTFRARTGAIELNIDMMPLYFDDATAAKATESLLRRAKKIAGTEKAAYRQEYEGKPELVVYFEEVTILCDALSTCKYLSPWNGLPLSPRYQAALFSAGSGEETDEKALFAFARRIRTLERAYEAGEGLTRDVEILPKRFMDKPIEKGKFQGEILVDYR